jgi:ABC-type sugar transport system ATPase subunit
VRPEDVQLAREPGTANLLGEVYAFELLGDNTLVTVKLEGQYFVAKLEKGERVKEGDPIAFYPPGTSLLVRRRKRRPHRMRQDQRHRITDTGSTTQEQ